MPLLKDLEIMNQMQNFRRISRNTFGVIALFVFFGKCSDSRRSNTNKSANCTDLRMMAFDIDSSLIIGLPKTWDSLAKLHFYNQEDIYYQSFFSRESKEHAIIRRVKFKNAEVDYSKLINYYENNILTTGYYSSLKRIDLEERKIGNRAVGIIDYSGKYELKPCIIHNMFYVNPDSSRTEVDIMTCDQDSLQAINRMRCIVESVEVK